MKMDSRIDRILSRVPLTPKLLIITLFVWGLVWGILEYLQSNQLKKITDIQLTHLLEQQARENRIRFDNYVMAYHDMAVLIVSQKAFVDHVRGYAGFSDGTKGIKYHTEIPAWLPDASVMRHFVRIHNAVLIDGMGRVREVYQGTSGIVPRSLLPPSALLLKMSRGQSMLTVVDGVPYLIVSDAVKDPNRGDTLALALISPVDDDFLSASQGVISGRGIIALVETARQQVVASNAPDLIPAGTQLDLLADRYLITSKAFFDWGGSEMLMQFTALVSKDELAEMGRAMLVEGRVQRSFISLALLMSFAMIMFWITGKIHLLTENIGDFSHNILNMRLPEISTGRDQLRILEERFAMFKDEIIGSREKLKRQAEELLREKTVYLDTLLHSSSMAVVATDLDLKIKYFNPTAETLFSISAETAIGKTVSETKLDERLDIPCFEKIINDSDGDEECISTTINKTAKGEQILESKVSIVKDAEGNISGLLMITQDITERKKAEEQRLELERQLLHSQKLESIGVLAGGVAHDFNNLLMAVLGNLHLALMKLSPGTPVRTLIEQAIQASNRTADLTRQMLAYSGKGMFIIEKLDINEMVKENASLLNSTVAKTAMLGIDLQPDISRIEADSGQIQQVIMHLLINASEAIGENTGVIMLSTGEMECDETYLRGSRTDEVPKAGRFVYLEVSDTGSGMDVETQQHMFDPFYSTKFTGRGLGMSAVFGIVRSHRGAIMVDSVMGRGTTIRVLFPAEAL
ncbi:MAG: PAS domain S-box protein [Nitrospirae bacterium]|nr:PAS domain S-box protein [Nitrospirota bacterium]